MIKTIKTQWFLCCSLLLLSLGVQAAEKPGYVLEMEHAISKSAEFAIEATRKSGGFAPFAVFFSGKDGDSMKMLNANQELIRRSTADTLATHVAAQAREYVSQNKDVRVATLTRPYHATADDKEVPGFLVFVDHQASEVGLLYFIPLLQRSETEYYLGEAVQQATRERFFHSTVSGKKSAGK